MKILIVDDERAFGSLLGRALKKLGHRSTIVCHPADALALLDDAEQPFDAVITDIHMPEMNGVDLATQIRARCSYMPIAFSTGSAPDDSILRAASRLGKVLPKVWTVADVRVLVEHLERVKIARGSDRIPRVTPSPAGAQPRREAPRRLRLALRTWDEVQKLCDRQATGRPQVTLRGNNPVSPGQRVTVALSLPDELALSIGAEVIGCTQDASQGKFLFAINLVELTPEVCARLRSMCVSAGAGKKPGSYSKVERPERTERGKAIGAVRKHR